MAPRVAVAPPAPPPVVGIGETPSDAPKGWRWSSGPGEWVKRHATEASVLAVGSLASGAASLTAGDGGGGMLGLGLGAAALATAAAPMAQSQTLHEQSMQMANSQHREALELDRLQHLQEVRYKVGHGAEWWRWWGQRWCLRWRRNTPPRHAAATKCRR